MQSNKALDTRYLLIYNEIINGHNLHQHLTDLNGVILQVEAIIQENDTEPLPLELWEQMRKELYFLKDEVIKRL